MSVDASLETVEVAVPEHDRLSRDDALDDRTIGARTASPSDPPQSIGAQVGRYVVLGELGRGGMGLVLRAYDPKLQRELALKCLKPGVLAHEQRARLVREAQAMAKLSHPNVVAIYDVEIEDEHVTLAMEYVEGQTLEQWLKNHARSPAEIVACFIEAGRGLAAAHEAGLLHRDFKPANVLVSQSGRVKVTDFGLARLDDERAASSTDSTDSSEALEEVSAERRRSNESSPLTQAGNVMGTPAYMAPEQHMARAVTPAADQYAFCVSLWQALTGALPFSRPGSKLRHVLERKRAGAPAWPRSSTNVPRRWVEAIRRGLSADPSQRWPSMAGLLAELSYHPTRRRRQWRIGGAVVLAIVAGFGWQAYGRAKTTADCDAEGREIAAVWNPDRAHGIAEAFTQTGIAHANDTWLRAAPRVEAFAQDWQEMRTQLCLEGERDGRRSADMLARARSCFDEHETHLRSLVAHWSAPNDTIVKRTANAAWALPPLKRCLDESELVRRNPAQDDPVAFAADQELRERLAETSALEATGQYADALAMAEHVLQESSARGRDRMVVQARRVVGEIQDTLGRYEEAKVTLERAHVEAETTGDDEQVLAIANRLVHTVGNNLAANADAHQWYRLAQMKRARLGLGPEHPSVATSLNNIGNVYRNEGRHDDAETAFAQALSSWEQALGPDHPNVAMSLNNLGTVYELQGKHDAALTAFERALSSWEQSLGPEHPNVALALNNMGAIHRGQGRYEEALAVYQRALSIRKQMLGPDHPHVAGSLNNIGNAYQSKGQYDEALAAHQQALAIWEPALGAQHPDVAMSLNNIGRVRQSQGHLDEALAAYHRALSIREQALGAEHSFVAATLNDIGEVQHSQGRYDEALASHQRAISIAEAALGADHPEIAGFLVDLSRVHLAQDRPADALPLLERALEIRTEAESTAAELTEVRDLLARARR